MYFQCDADLTEYCEGWGFQSEHGMPSAGLHKQGDHARRLLNFMQEWGVGLEGGPDGSPPTGYLLMDSQLMHCERQVVVWALEPGREGTRESVHAEEGIDDFGFVHGERVASL